MSPLRQNAPRVFRIAVLPGDGIGPEVIREALRVLEVIVAGFRGIHFEFTHCNAGATEYLRHGDPLPDSVLAHCRHADAVLLGAMGLPGVRWPDGREMTPQIDLREQLQLYCGLRPVHLYHESHTPLKDFATGQIDLVIVRESTEGLFSSRHQTPDLNSEAVSDTLLITRSGSLRVCRAAFREARRRRSHVTLVDKANVLPSMVYLRSIFDQVATEFPDVRTDRIYVDAAALYLLQRPQTFDVIVTENMFGDILSDLAAGLAGGMGMAPSADLGDQHAVFQPVHGTAPDIAGLGIANPVAMILSTALMLDWLDHDESRRGAQQIRDAVRTVLRDAENRTPDLGGTLTTTQMTDRILKQIEHP